MKFTYIDTKSIDGSFMLIVVAVIGGRVKSGMRRKRMILMRRNDIATNDTEVLQLRQKLVTRIGLQIPDLPIQPYGFQAIISNGKLILCGGPTTKQLHSTTTNISSWKRGNENGHQFAACFSLEPIMPQFL